ncbi:MAG: type II toxin-antitoxin system VapC family toxin [Steroidobacteraceae bacterium]
MSPPRQQDHAALDEYLRHVEVLDFPGEAALHYAQIGAALKAYGTMIGANDLFIAAHARSLQLTLVTNNTDEFSRVEGLKVENERQSGWVAGGAARLKSAVSQWPGALRGGAPAARFARQGTRPLSLDAT